MFRMLYIAIVFAAFVHHMQLFAAEPSPKIKDFFKPKMIEILTGVERVETFRIKGKLGGGFDELAKGPVWKDEKAKAVAAIFLDEKSYEWEQKKLCDPQPGVMFKLFKGDERIEVLLCFECDIVQFIALDAKGQKIASAINDFDPARPKLVKLTKEALPDDKVIQGLKESR
jgi:hypothetical protein